MKDGRNEGRWILVSGARASKGERWREGYSNAESAYVRSPEIPRSPRRELAELQYLRANGWENAGAPPKG
jgi:hypothetical protein